MDSDPNAGQRDHWCSEAGQEWIDNETVLDAALAPDAHLLDIGRGTVDLTLAAARRAPAV